MIDRPMRAPAEHGQQQSPDERLAERFLPLDLMNSLFSRVVIALRWKLS